MPRQTKTMRDKGSIVVILALLSITLVNGQCIDRDSLKSQLNYLKNANSVSADEKLRLLVSYGERIKNCPYKFDSTHCLLLRTIGNLYFEKTDYLRAIFYYQQGIDILSSRKGSSSVKPEDLVEFYYFLSDAYGALNRTSERLTSLDSVLATGKRLKLIHNLCLWSLYCKTEYYFNVGDYNRCIETAAMCEALGKEYAASPAEKDFPCGMFYASSSLHWNVNALLALHRYRDAGELLINRAEDYKKTNNANLGILYEQLGETMFHNGDYAAALLYFQEAFRRERARGNSTGCMAILNNIGFFIYYLNNRNLDSALYYYRRALSVRSTSEGSNRAEALESVAIYDDIGNAYARKGLFDSAYSYYQLAFDQIELGTDEDKLVNSSEEKLKGIGKIRYVTTLLIDKGTAYHLCYKTTGNRDALSRAIRVYKLTDQFLDRVKAGQFDTDSKLFWRGDSRRLYEQAIQASFAANNLQDAFYFFEKSRAVILNDELSEQRWISEQDIIRQTQLKLKINLLQHQLGNSDIDVSQSSALESTLYSSTQELDALNEKIRIKNPLYYQNFIDSARITLDNARSRILRDHQAIIEIYAGDSAIYELVLLKGRDLSRTIDKKKFDHVSQLYMSYLSDPSSSNSHFDDFVKVSKELYQLLLSGIQISPGRIVISPSGMYFPFEALVTSADNGNIKYFLHDYSITYSYSARYLLNDFGVDSNSDSKNFVGFAPVTFRGSKLTDLTGSDVSLLKLRNRFRESEAFVREDATRNNFLQKFYSFKIIQLYTHAAASGYNGEPVIWFSDTSLSLSDLIYERRPAAKLIVLAACETGKGKFYQGEGIFSFNRGFAALGIPSSISNLWSVDNKSSYQITELFYKYLRKGMSTDVALQKAKLDFVSTQEKEKQMPYYWAASVFVGISQEFEPEHEKALSLPLVIGFVLMVACIALVIIYKKYLNRLQS